MFKKLIFQKKWKIIKIPYRVPLGLYTPYTPRSEKVDPVRYQVPAFCYVKPTRDHLQKVQFDLPDRSRGVPELPRANFGAQKPQKLNYVEVLSGPFTVRLGSVAARRYTPRYGDPVPIPFGGVPIPFGEDK